MIEVYNASKIRRPNDVKFCISIPSENYDRLCNSLFLQEGDILCFEIDLVARDSDSLTVYLEGNILSDLKVGLSESAD